MRKSRVTEEQILLVVQQAEASLDATEFCRKYGVSHADVLPLVVTVRHQRAQSVSGIGVASKHPPLPQPKSGHNGAASPDPRSSSSRGWVIEPQEHIPSLQGRTIELANPEEEAHVRKRSARPTSEARASQ